MQPSQFKEFLDVNKNLSGLTVTKGTEKPKASKLLDICACGTMDPKFKGYCEECLRKLKDTYDRYLAKFKTLS